MNRRGFLALFVLAYSAAMAKAGLKLERPWDPDHIPPARYLDRLRWSVFERIWLAMWQIENNPPCFLNHGIGVLEHIMDREPTAAEKCTAAGIMQWFGTNCGHGFIVEVLRVQGYKVVQDEETRGPLRKYQYLRGPLPKTIPVQWRGRTVNV